jgi:hydroxypyruvate isomerase
MPKFAANLSFLYTELPLLDRIGAAAKSGFRGVEYMSPYEEKAADIAAKLREHGQTQVLFNLPSGNWAGGERGIAIYPDRVKEFRANVPRAIDYAHALGCGQVNCLAGLVSKDIEHKAQHATFVENMAFTAAEFAKAKIKLLIEPINTRDIPGFFLTHTAQASRIIDEVGSNNLFIQYDIYHMQIMEGDLARTIEANLPRIAHIQLADNPGRNEPGTGEINYPFLFGHIDKLGYSGWIGCEYKPRAGVDAGLGWMAPYRAK